MSNKITSLHSTFSVNGEISDNDTRFLNITIDVLHTGQNLNGSVFDKDVVDSCVESIKNTPVLGFIKYDNVSKETDFKGHEHILTKTENGIEEKYIGSAFGVIPESCNPRWFTKMCPDGKEREFLQVDALLWEKFSDATSILYRDGEKSESMELEISSVEGYEDDDGIFHFDSFRFDGCCLLGEDVDPAMIGANVKISEVQFTMGDFVEDIQKELNDKFATFSKLINDTNDQGGVRNMPETNYDFAQTVLEQFADISVMVSQYETMENYWGDQVPRFYAVDVQEDEVIAVDAKDSYRYYGFKFSIDGDKPEIDFTSAARKKLRYEDYEEGSVEHDGGFDFGKHISDISEVAFAKVNDANAKVEEVEQAKAEVEANYTQVKAEYDEIKPKYDEYVQIEEQRQHDELNAQKDGKFAEYEDVLGENPDFVALKEKKDEMSVEDIEKECAVMYVKASRSKASFSKGGSASAIIGVLDDGDDHIDGYVETKYGLIHTGR